MIRIKRLEKPNNTNQPRNLTAIDLMAVHGGAESNVSSSYSKSKDNIANNMRA